MTIKRKTSRSMRTKRFAAPATTGDLGTTSAPKAHRTSNVEDQWAVSSTWGDQVAVSDSELAVLELYLSEIIDQLVGVAPTRRRSSSQPRGPP